MCGLLEPIGALLGFVLAATSGLPIQDRCTVSLETGVQASTLAIAVTELSFEAGKVRDSVLKGPLIYSIFYLVHSMWLVLLFRNLTSKQLSQSQFSDELEMTKGQQMQTGSTKQNSKERV